MTSIARQSRTGLKNTADSIMQDNAYNYSTESDCNDKCHVSVPVDRTQSPCLAVYLTLALQTQTAHSQLYILSHYFITLVRCIYISLYLITHVSEDQQGLIVVICFMLGWCLVQLVVLCYLSCRSSSSRALVFRLVCSCVRLFVCRMFTIRQILTRWRYLLISPSLSVVFIVGTQKIAFTNLRQYNTNKIQGSVQHTCQSENCQTHGNIMDVFQGMQLKSAITEFLSTIISHPFPFFLSMLVCVYFIFISLLVIFLIMEYILTSNPRA